MKIKMRTDGSHNTIATVVGEIDSSNSEDLKIRLLCVLHNMHSPVMIIRLNRMPFIDAAGLATLVAVNHRAGLLHRDLRITEPMREPAKILQITGLDQQLAIYPSLADAQRPCFDERTVVTV